MYRTHTIRSIMCLMLLGGVLLLGGCNNDNAPDTTAQLPTSVSAALKAYVKASNSEAGDTFSGSVALSGDTLAVGAIGEASCADGIGGDQTDNGCGIAGAVYVFTRTAGVWTQQAYVKA
ncbi:FG-GAP repeat protein, partial [Nitrospira sp. NS4]|uniref:FG-GAP repeat protein n=1 Tax=Nitrospira sp. NS4 TaxID=3414498 RepID=UPI003C2F7F61